MLIFLSSPIDVLEASLFSCPQSHCLEGCVVKEKNALIVRWDGCWVTFFSHPAVSPENQGFEWFSSSDLIIDWLIDWLIDLIIHWLIWWFDDDSLIVSSSISEKPGPSQCLWLHSGLCAICADDRSHHKACLIFTRGFFNADLMFYGIQWVSSGNSTVEFGIGTCELPGPPEDLTTKWAAEKSAEVGFQARCDASIKQGKK